MASVLHCEKSPPIPPAYAHLNRPPDFTSLAAFDPQALQQYVTFFNFMAYDLHGPWEEPYIGHALRPQASIIDIEKAILPVWFDSINPKKINLGLPYYGRGYTISDTSCTDIGCPYTGLSRAAQCSGSPGVLSLKEIQQIIAQRHLVPKYLPDIMQKQITFDDQWMAYDDCDTFEAKIKYGDAHCLGGVMYWSIDLTNSNGRWGPCLLLRIFC